MKTLRTFKRDQSGVALVEFAISLPLLLLVLAVVIEGSRIAWTHQVAQSGVRDAARFIARIAPPNICDDTTDIDAYQEEAEEIVTERLGQSQAVFPGGVTINSVTPTLRCVSNGYNVATVSIVEVRAQVLITLPFGGIFDLFGDPLDPILTEIAEESRVFGI